MIKKKKSLNKKKEKKFKKEKKTKKEKDEKLNEVKYTFLFKKKTLETEERNL
jgi:hypothetical protein